MAKTVATIYVDESSIRLLVARKKGVKQWTDKPLDPGMVDDGVILQEAEVAATIRDLLKAEGISAKKVIAGLSGVHCLSRVITLPRLPRSLLGEAVNREAKRVIPIPLEQLYIAWKVIPGRGAELRVFLVALPRNSTDALVRTLRQAGINPHIMDLKPLALARLADRDTAIVADVQSAEVDIVVVAGKVVQLMRTIALPAEARTRINKLSVVEEELDRTIKFYNSSHPEEPLSPDIPILVSGELVNESTATPNVVEMRPLAVAREAGKDTALVADIRASAVDIVLIVDKAPQLMRTISLPDEPKLRAEKLARLEEELDKTVKFYNSSHAEHPLSADIPVLISGEEGKGPGAEQPLPRTREFRSPATPLTSPLKYPQGFDPVRYAVNIGLALKELAHVASPMNLNVLPETYRPKPRSLTEVVFVPSVTVAVAVLMPLLLLVQNAGAHTAALRNQLAVSSRISKERQVQKTEIDTLKKKVDSAIAARDANSKVLTYFSQSQETVNRDLGAATSLIPATITMTSLSNTGDRVIISGTAADEVAILGYAQSLRESKRFALVVITNISTDRGETAFRFTLMK